MDWVQLISDLIIPVLGLIFTVLVAPAIRESRWREYAETAVRAAEQIFGGKTGTEKYEFAEKLLMRRFSISEQDAERLIESAVYGLRQAGSSLLGEDGADAALSGDGGLGTEGAVASDSAVTSDGENVPDGADVHGGEGAGE